MLATTTVAICRAPGCECACVYKGLCRPHYDRHRRTGLIDDVRHRARSGAGYRRKDGRVAIDVDGRKRLLHVLIVERAIGHALPPGAEVHHIDENPGNNDPTNLVVCPDAAYHKLLHQRQRAFDACGHYDWRKCTFCKKYDAPGNLHATRKQAYHSACATAKTRARRQHLKETHV